VFLGAFGRLISMREFGIPKPAALWLSYFGSEIIFPLILLFAQLSTDAQRQALEIGAPLKK